MTTKGSLKKKSVSKNDVIGEIRMYLKHPSASQKVWMIVEGETDQRLFAKLIAENVQILAPGGGLPSVLEVVETLLLEETEFIIGIRDADFLHLQGKKTPQNIFCTDFHDIEMLLIACDATYCAVAAEYLSAESEPLLPLREKILQSVAFLGGIRWLNDEENLQLKCDFSLGISYDAGKLQLDEQKCLDDVLKKSPHQVRVISKKEVDQKIQGIRDFLNLCNGHDVQNALRFRINSQHKSDQVSEDTLACAFRIAYRLEDFKKTKLYAALKAWAEQKARSLFKEA